MIIQQIDRRAEAMAGAEPKLGPSVVHCFRAPLGGLFRHVCDMAHGQAERGLRVGIVCDSTTGDDHTKMLLANLESTCELGVHQFPMKRRVAITDLSVMSGIASALDACRCDIIHGHGAKGGVYARALAGRVGAKSVYTPHGGSLHSSLLTPPGWISWGAERFLRDRTDGFLFECASSAKKFAGKIGAPRAPVGVVHNGLHAWECESVVRTEPEFDFVFVGELRKLKGVHLLLEATARLQLRHKVRVLVAGGGPDADVFRHRARQLGLERSVSWSGPVYPATAAFRRARCLVMPSLAEGFPYVVLEAAAARVPMVASDVGGISEIFGAHADRLVPPGDVDALAREMARILDDPADADRTAEDLQQRVRQNFSVDSMVDKAVGFYHRILDSSPDSR